MAVKTVTGKLTGPSNAAIGGVLVTAQLSASAVIAATQEIAPLAVTTQTATDGTWSLSLQANGDLTPGSTYYTVSVGPNWTATAIVPQTAGPFLIENIMAVAPAAWLGGTAATLNPAGDLAVRSLTVLPSGPYGAFLPGAPTIPTPAGIATGSNWDYGGMVYHAKTAGAKCDVQRVTDGVMNGNNAVLTSASGKFVASDVGKHIDVQGAGPGATYLASSIASYQSPTQVTLSASSQTAVAAAVTSWGTIDTAAIQGLMNTAQPLGAAVFIPGVAFIDAPLTCKLKTAIIAQRAPTLLGWGPGALDDGTGPKGCSTLQATATFPIGEYMIDYIGSLTTLFAPLTGYRIEGLALECISRGAGIRQCNHLKTLTKDIMINQPAVPAPADTTGTPNAACSFVKQNAFDSSYDNHAHHISIYSAAKDGIESLESSSSSMVLVACSAISSLRYNYALGDNTVAVGCDAQSAVVANWYVWGGILIGCTEEFQGTAPMNSVILDNPFGVNARRIQFSGCMFAGPTTAGTEAASAMIRVFFSQQHTLFSGCSFQAGTGTTDWLYFDAGPSTGTLQFTGCDFHTLRQPITQKFNYNGSTITTFRACTGLNPLGAVTTPGFPATTVAVTNNTGVDVQVFLLNGANPLTLQIDAVAALIVIPANQPLCFTLPSRSTFTPTYAGGIPTHKWYGL